MSDSKSLGKRPRGLLKSKKAATSDEPASKRARPDDKADTALSVTEDAVVTAQDWDDLKELMLNALEAVGSEDPKTAAPLLRGIIHECDRFVRHHPSDPSLVYRQSGTQTADPSIAFPVIHAWAFYLLGTLFRDHSAVAATGEPAEAAEYFSVASELLGEADAGATTPEAPEIWRAKFEFLSGLSALALFVEEEAGNDGMDQDEDPSVNTKVDAVLKVASSHFALGAKLCPLHVSVDEDTIEFALSQRTSHLLEASTAVLSIVGDGHLLPIEKTAHWSAWVDDFIKNEPLSALIELRRGHCWLILALQYAEKCETQMDDEEEDVEIDWEGDLAVKTRKLLHQALGHLRKAEELIKPDDDVANMLRAEAKNWIGETLLNLGNLTQDEKQREAFYTEAKENGASLDDDETEAGQ